VSDSSHYAGAKDLLRLHHVEPVEDALHGITGNLIQPVRRHKLGIASRFTTKYKLDRLVYFEWFESVHNAIEREKEIKGWLRIKKIALIVSVNPA
jgi:putative endonuclease